MSSLSTRQTIGLVLIFALTCIAFIGLDSRNALDPLKSALHNLVVPVTDTFNGFGRRSPSDLEKELEQVKQERDAAIAENVRLKADQQNVDNLKAALDFKTSNAQWTIVAANVLNGDPTNQQKFVVIDKGSADGIRPGMAVTDPNYFVGLVSTVEEHSARVILVIDDSSTIGAQLADTGANGIVYGKWRTGGRLEMAYVDRLEKPKKGEMVVTSQSVEARTAGVPGNLLIGIVEEDPETFNQGDSQTIKVVPAADLDNLTIVTVIVSDGETNN